MMREEERVERLGAQVCEREENGDKKDDQFGAICICVIQNVIVLNSFIYFEPLKGFEIFGDMMNFRSLGDGTCS